MPADQPLLPEGGYCFDCRIAFGLEAEAEAHYHMTGHQIGWPLEDVDWPQATEAQVMGRARSQGQIVSDMEMDRQAARDGYNPGR